MSKRSYDCADINNNQMESGDDTATSLKTFWETVGEEINQIESGSIIILFFVSMR
jgi:hypothetical protein